MTETSVSWKSWLGIVAVLLGMLAAAQQGTELMRHAVIVTSTPADGELPPAACPADELEEEGLTGAECRQMVSNVRNIALSAPGWFSSFQMGAAALGVLTALAGAIAGAGMLNERAWAPAAAAGAFGLLAGVETASFMAALNAGPIVRDLYLWELLRWLAVHLAVVVAALAGRHRPSSADAMTGGSTATSRPRPFSRTAVACHWFLAVSVLFLFASSWWMLALPLPSAEFTYRAFPFQLHKNLGITLVFVLALLLYARFRHPPSRAASNRLSPRMRRLAALDHVALYVLIFAACVTGYLSSSYSGWATTLWWLVDLPHWGYENEDLNMLYSDLHLWSCWGLLVLIAAHVCGALYHAFVSDGYVARMLRP